MALPWTDSMSTSEHRAVDAESDLPLSSAELSALASQLPIIQPTIFQPPNNLEIGVVFRPHAEDRVERCAYSELPLSSDGTERGLAVSPIEEVACFRKLFAG